MKQVCRKNLFSNDRSVLRISKSHQKEASLHLRTIAFTSFYHSHEHIYNGI